MKLFSVGHVGVFLESLGHRMEKRKSGEVKVHVLGCWPQPPKFGKEVAVVAVGTGRNNRARWFTVFERTRI